MVILGLGAERGGGCPACWYWVTAYFCAIGALYLLRCSTTITVWVSDPPAAGGTGLAAACLSLGFPALRLRGDYL